MPKFEVGDKALVIARPIEWVPGNRDLLGEIVTIVGPLTRMHNAVSNRSADVYEVDTECLAYNCVTACEPHTLKPIGDDGEDVSWKQVEMITGWKPKESVHVETSS